MNSKSIYSIHSEAICNAIDRKIQSSFSLKGLPSLTGEVARSTFQLPTTKSKILLEKLQIDEDVTEALKPWINWSPPGYLPGDLRTLKCQLYALRTDGDGNCLLHACSLAMFGSHDRQQTLRSLLSNLLLDEEFGKHFKKIWEDAEKCSDATLGEAAVERDADQFEKEWEGLVNAAVMSGEFLSSFHIYLLAHVIRRPIIVYGDSYIRDKSGDRYAPNSLRGIFLPTELPAKKIEKEEDGN
mmetsp:Transcript_12366/g.15972  ORF Transcript_12366/g.15972 Transcript_12366/m.15972 type:complete len:241 (+) Transcript_12366:53-775(+)